MFLSSLEDLFLTYLRQTERERERENNISVRKNSDQLHALTRNGTHHLPV